MPWDFKDALGGAGLDAPHLVQLFLRMALASLLGASIAYRPWRRFVRKTPKPALQGAQSQTLIAAAGALLVVVIGDNIARAFGLVGLGAFIRFRALISDPRDAAVLLIVIGIGMACGLGLPLMAVAGTVFVCILLAIFDATAKKRTRVSLYSPTPALVIGHLASVFPGAKMLDLSTSKTETGKEAQKLVIEADLDPNADAASIQRLLEAKSVPGVTRVAIEE
jgi:hypothetical protein